MAYKIWLFLWYFVLASFCGWVAEVGYIGMVYRKFKNPGMLNGPYCPQYGLMIALPWAALTALHWQTSFVATLFFCLISSFLVEFTFAWLLRKTTHIRLRDYSKFKWNIKGYVSVPVATVRGVCFSFIVVFIVPVLTSLLHYVNRTVGWVTLYAVLGIMLLDIIITAMPSPAVPSAQRRPSMTSTCKRSFRKHRRPPTKTTRHSSTNRTS